MEARIRYCCVSSLMWGTMSSPAYLSADQEMSELRGPGK